MKYYLKNWRVIFTHADWYVRIALLVALLLWVPCAPSLSNIVILAGTIVLLLVELLVVPFLRKASEDLVRRPTGILEEGRQQNEKESS